MKSPLVLVGDTVKLRIQQNRAESGRLVSIDWFRATFKLAKNFDDIFPLDLKDYEKFLKLNCGEDAALRTLSNYRHHAVQAWDLAEEVCRVLGPDYYVDALVGKGRDFYRYRLSIRREGAEVGWVGFVGNTSSAYKARQDETLHVNLYGEACTFAAHGWGRRMQNLVERREAVITRIDLALDDFDAAPDFLERCRSDYEAGLMDVTGHRPKMSMVGHWLSDGTGNSRSLYIGSREAGKQTNIYEKGHQLYGADSDSRWVRVELRYGNKLRVLDPEVLSDPDGFFAGASDWHAQTLREIRKRMRVPRISWPKPLVTKSRLAVETLKAELSRNARWLIRVAAPSVFQAFRNAGDDFLEMFAAANTKPRRLSKFSDAEISAVYPTVFRAAVGLPDCSAAA